MKKVNVLIEGERIYLRKIALSDVNKKYLAWMNDSSVNQYLESRFTYWSPDKLRQFIRKNSKGKDNLFLAIVLKDTGVHIGNIKIGPINHIHKYAEVGILIGERDCWGKGYATEAIKLAVEYGFKKLKLHKLIAGAYENNAGSIKAFKKASFSVEGIQKKHFRFQNSYCGRVLLGIVKE